MPIRKVDSQQKVSGGYQSHASHYHQFEYEYVIIHTCSLLMLWPFTLLSTSLLKIPHTFAWWFLHACMLLACLLLAHSDNSLLMCPIPCLFSSLVWHYLVIRPFTLLPLPLFFPSLIHSSLSRWFSPTLCGQFSFSHSGQICPLSLLNSTTHVRIFGPYH